MLLKKLSSNLHNTSIVCSVSLLAESNCTQILRADGAHRLASRLMDYDPSQQLMFRSVDVLWNLLENAPQEEVMEQLNNMACVR